MQDGEDDGWPPGLRHAEDEMFSAGSHAQAGEQKTHVLVDPDTLSDGLRGLLDLGDIGAASRFTPVRDGVPGDVAQSAAAPLLTT